MSGPPPTPVPKVEKVASSIGEIKQEKKGPPMWLYGSAAACCILCVAIIFLSLRRSRRQLRSNANLNKILNNLNRRL